LKSGIAGYLISAFSGAALILIIFKIVSSLARRGEEK
jgi:hypothetical protein